MVSHRTNSGIEGFSLLTHSSGEELSYPYHLALVKHRIFILKALAIAASVYLQQ